MGARGKTTVTYKGNPFRLSGFSVATLQASKEWNDIFEILKNRSNQLRVQYPAKLSFRCEGEIKSFPDTQKLRHYITTDLTASQDLLNGALLCETKKQSTQNFE